MGNTQPKEPTVTTEEQSVGPGAPKHKKVGNHSAIPADVVPYAGPQIQHCFINVEASLQTQATFFSTPIVTTNIDAYYPLISQSYGNGFILDQFQMIPGVFKTQAFSMTIGMPFQAILSRPVNAPMTHERWQLRIEKSVLYTQQVVQFFSTTSQSVADSSDIFKKVNALTCQGGRLICIETTGCQKGYGLPGSNPMMQQNRGRGGNQARRGQPTLKGVDLFFNMPLHPNPTIYVYQAVTVPVQIKLTSSFPTPKIEVQTDFMAQFSAFLQKGWKLVEINFDSSMTATSGFMKAKATCNSIWFFEKEVAKAHSEDPEWEGTIIEYEHKIKTALGGGTRAKTSWDSVIGEMGQRGWELACLLESPEMYTTGFATAAIKVLMFFQRRILQPRGAEGYSAPQGGYPPPQGGYPPPQGDGGGPSKEKM